MDKRKDFIREPGLWLNEPLSEEESADVVELAKKISEAKRNGIKAQYTDVEEMTLTPEWGQALDGMAPYLNAFMHFIYGLAQTGNFPDWMMESPVLATLALLDFIVNDDDNGLDQLPGQIAITEMDTTPDITSKTMKAGKSLSGKVRPKGLDRESLNVDLLQSLYLPLLNNRITNGMMPASCGNLSHNKKTGVAVFAKDDLTITLYDFPDLTSPLETSTKKLLDTAVLFLTNTNFYRTDNINPSVTIPLIDYWKSQGFLVTPADDSQEEATRIENCIKHLKKQIRKDLTAIRHMRWNLDNGKAGDGDYISSWRFLSENRVKINFDMDIAKALLNSQEMQFPTALLRLDNRKHNSYAIGRKIAYHHSMDSNVAVGTANTLSVKAMLEAAPEIPSYDDLVRARRRDWKAKIKKKLESSLNSIVDIGYLERWEYRDPLSKKVRRLTVAETDSFTWEDYSRLVIDFTVKDEPDQDGRRAKRAAEKAARQENADKPKRPRGRPRKENKG